MSSKCGLHLEDKTTFLSDLMESLSYFGKVLQVKKFIHRGYFEGKLSVILDTSVRFQVGEEWQEAKPRDRMLYLSEYDCFVPATYQGASPICHFCQHNGHVRAKCPELARHRCFRHNKHGHMMRFCPEGKQADFFKKRKLAEPSEGSQDIQMARDAADIVMDHIDQEKFRHGQNEEDEQIVEILEPGLEEEQERDENTDHQEEEFSTDKLHKYMEEDEVVWAGAGKSVIKGSVYLKYAQNSIAIPCIVENLISEEGLFNRK